LRWIKAGEAAIWFPESQAFVIIATASACDGTEG
jgi:hypothetical protein